MRVIFALWDYPQGVQKKLVLQADRLGDLRRLLRTSAFFVHSCDRKLAAGSTRLVQRAGEIKDSNCPT
jgi:hypothetical protein